MGGHDTEPSPGPSAGPITAPVGYRSAGSRGVKRSWRSVEPGKRIFGGALIR